MAQPFGSLSPGDSPIVDVPGVGPVLDAEAGARLAAILGQGPLGHMVKGIVGGAMAPGEALKSTPDNPVSTEQMVKPAADLAGALAGWGTSIAQKGTAGIFGGRLAKTADHQALAKAEEMVAAGHAPSDILEATGWFQGADNKWRFEIPDQSAVVDSAALRPTGRLARADQYLKEHGSQHFTGDPRLSDNLKTEALQFADQTANSRGTIPMKDYLKHDDLYAAYPHLAETPVGMETQANLRGSFDPNVNIIRTGGGSLMERGAAKDTTVLHELQHAVQKHEGFARGGNPDEFAQAYKDQLAGLGSRVGFINEQLKKAAGTPEYDLLLDVRKSIVDKLLKLQETMGEKSFRDYKNLAGEVEARNVQTRANWDAPKRRDIPPIYSQDVPTSEQVVRFGSMSPR